MFDRKIATNNRRSILTMRLLVRFICVPFIVTLPTSCADGNTKNAFRSELISIGTTEFIVPENYINSYDAGTSALIVAAWPSMEGKTSANFESYRKSNVRILLTPGSPGRLKSIYKYFILDDSEICRSKNQLSKSDLEIDNIIVKSPITNCHNVTNRLIERGKMGKFRHFVTYSGRAVSRRRGSPHMDIFLSESSSGDFEAVMRCDGEPAPPNRNPQCNLWRVYSSLPNVLFKISFHRRKALDSVHLMDGQVIKLFLSFSSK